MSGFGTVVGFMFSFFVIILVITTVIFNYNEQILEQKRISDNYLETKSLELFGKYYLEDIFLSSGRVDVNFKSDKKSDIFFKNENQEFCFNSFINNFFIPTNYFKFNIIDKSPIYNYTKISDTEIGKITILKNLNKNIENDFKFTTCKGLELSYKLDPNKINWYDKNLQNRIKFNLSNPSNTDLVEYQVNIKLNSSIINPLEFKLNDVNFVYPLINSQIIDLPFDNYKEELDDFSKINSLITLGPTNNIESENPSQNQNGVFFNALDFDGVNDYVLVLPNPAYDLTKEITISAWVKWNGAGNSLQNIFTNGGWSNALRIYNDGSLNQDKILFQLNIDGSVYYLNSTSKLDNQWHMVTATYDGVSMKIFLDGNLDSKFDIKGEIIPFSGNSQYIGSEGANYYFNGSIDEFKLFDIALNENEIKDLYSNNLRFRELDFYNYEFSQEDDIFGFFVKIPVLRNSTDLEIEMYYNGINNSQTSKSNERNTFSYKKERLIGYVLSNRIASNTGISILSLEDNNSIIIGSNSYNLNFLDTQTINVASLNNNDKVLLSGLAQVEGNGNGDDIIAPISFSSREFYYRGFRGATDTFCMIAPFGDSWVEIRDATVLEWNGTVSSNSVLCQVMDIGTSSNLAINSTLPILVYNWGGTANDAMVLYPATSEKLFGIPSGAGYLAVGPNGGNIFFQRSAGSVLSSNLGSYGTVSFSDGGNQGTASGHKITINAGNKMGALQQADGDGSESTTFLTKKEFGTIYGSSLNTEYITIISTYSDANCSVFDSGSNIIGNLVNGVGVSGIYKYDFGVGSSSNYASGPFYIKCQKPSMGYFEEDTNGDETNFLTYQMIRQYVYPEPIIKII